MKEHSVSERLVAFRKLHEAGCFVMPNPWDVGTAKLLSHLGFKALATTSAGVSFSLGRPDRLDSLTVDEVLRHVREMVAATDLPLNVDFQNGYGAKLEDLHANVMACAKTGAAGLSIEDASGEAASPLFDRAVAVERIRTAKAAIDESGTGVILTARCEAWLVGAPDAERIVFDRMVAFAEAGADCLFAPGIPDIRVAEELVKAVAPKPVNVIVSRPMAGFTVTGLAKIGVRRISVGSALSRVALGAVARSAREILENGEFGLLGEAMGFGEVNGVMGAGKV